MCVCVLSCDKEYEEGKTPEAVLVKDLDKFDMIFQAYEYETSKVCFVVCLCDFNKFLYPHSSGKDR